MAKQRIINTKFWSDDYITNLKPLERYLFLYLLTNGHTAICGVYELPLRIMAFETGLDKEMLLKILARFTKEKKIFYLKECWIFVKNFIKHQSSESKTVKIGIENSLRLVPCDILAQIKEIDISYAEGIDKVCTRYHILELEPEPELIPPTEVAPAGAPAVPQFYGTNQTSLNKKPQWTEEDSKIYIEQYMMNDKKVHIRILGYYFKAKDFIFENYPMVNAAIRRETRVAVSLLPYPLDDIIAVMEWCRRTQTDYEWKLETVFKRIDNYRAEAHFRRKQLTS